MSRLKKLKERKIKNKIKATSCGLALALLIGSVQGLGTYALFTDNVDVSKLAISTGDVDVSAGEGFKDDLIDKNNIITKSFKIKNQGTLRQKLQLGLITNTSISEEALKNINYNLTMTHGEKNIKPINLNFYEIKQMEPIDLEYEHGGKVILKPGEIIDCTATISLKNGSRSNQEKVNIEFNLNILASQIGYKKHKGFIGIHNQNNNFLIKKSNLEDLETNLDVEFEYDDDNDGCSHENKERYEIEIEIPGERKFRNLEIIKGTGQFKSIETCSKETDKDEFDIIKKPEGEFILGDGGIGTEYSDSQKLFVKIEFTTGEIETWEIKFRYRNNKLQAYYTVVNVEREGVEVPSEPEVVEPQKEEVEKPSKPEIVEPPKEEVEKPSEPEIVEPPKEEVEVPSEPEVVEPPKEEIVVPTQPDIIAPPKEETEIQE